MVELTIFVLTIVGLIVTRKMWGQYLMAKTDDVQLFIEDARNDQQSEMKRVITEREGIIKANGKWYTLNDLKSLEK